MEDALVALLTSRLDSIDRSISEEKRDSAESRRRVYEKLEHQDRKIEKILNRLEALEDVTSSMSPTIAEFVTMKTQVVGAGRLGSMLWKAGGYIMTAAVSFASAWAWITGFFSGTK